jgi:RNA polymerase sigma-70 factor (ECF subfamily)
MNKPGKEELDELVARAIDGDKTAFSEVVRRMMNPVVAFTYRMTRERESAIDLAQDTFVAAWQKLKTYRGESKFESWLFAIAANKTLNFIKTRDRQRGDSLESTHIELTTTDTPETEMAKKELRENVLAFMESLPVQQRLAFNLRFYQQLSFEEIAKTTGKALGTVKTNYREAVKKLRRMALEKGWKS